MQWYYYIFKHQKQIKIKHAPISNMSQTLSHHFHFYEDTMNQQKKMFTCLYCIHNIQHTVVFIT